MKKNIKVFVALCFTALTTFFGVTSCDKDCEHDFKYTVEKAATCTEDGLEIGTCSKCKETDSRVIAKLSHDFSGALSYDETFHWSVCNHGCNEVRNKVSHSFDDIKTTKPATCTEDGIKTYKCTACGYTKTEVIPMTPDEHPYESNWTTNGTHHWHKVTCIHDTNVVSYGEHNFTEWKHTQDATTEQEGKNERTCIICGYVDVEIIPKIHYHTYSELWSKNETYHWHAATCEHSDLVSEKSTHTFDYGTVLKAATSTESGTIRYTCDVCGYQYDEDIPVGLNECNVNFYDEDGSTLLYSTTINYGQKVTYDVIPTKEQTIEHIYIFANWVTTKDGNVEASLDRVKNHKNVYAKYNEEKRGYYVTFHNLNGSEIGMVEVKYGETIKEDEIPSEPVKSGYRGNGWKIKTEQLEAPETTFDKNTIVTTEINVEPKAYVKVWEVNFVDYDGSITTKIVDDGCKVEAPIFTREGYDFIGFGNTFNFSNQVITEDKTFNAQYELKFFTVQFGMPNNALIEEQTVAYGGNAIIPKDLPMYYYDGKSVKGFSGWIFNDSNRTDLINITQSGLVITAYYNEAITVPVVVYVVNNVSKTVDMYIALPENTKIFAINLKSTWISTDADTRKIEYISFDNSSPLYQRDSEKNCKAGNSENWASYNNLKNYFNLTWVCGNGHKLGNNKILIIKFSGSDFEKDMLDINDETTFIIGENYENAYSVKPEVIVSIKG